LKPVPATSHRRRLAGRPSHGRPALFHGVLRTFFIFLASLSTFVSRARACDEIQPWRKIYEQTLPENLGDASFDEERDAPKKEYAARVASTQALFASFNAGQATAASIRQCLEGIPELGDYLNTLNETFLKSSLASLRQQKVPAITALMAEYDRLAPPGSEPIFRVAGLFDDEPPMPAKGAYNRATHAILLDLKKTRRSEWLAIFTHELLHHEDPALTEASSAYSNRETADRILTLVRTTKRASRLSAKDRELVRRWLEAGLSRGLWAEYRAWYGTFAIYEQAVRAGLWEKIPRLEEVLAQKRPGEPFALFLYRYLDATSPSPVVNPLDAKLDPENAIFYEVFSSSLIQTLLQELREEYRNGQRPLPSLGRLEQIVGKPDIPSAEADRQPPHHSALGRGAHKPL
jgi:hypothetical protein